MSKPSKCIFCRFFALKSTKKPFYIKDGVTLDRKRNNVNHALKDKCIFNNFIFVDNKDICLEDITDFDKVHLNESGSVKLANNVLDALNNSH